MRHHTVFKKRTALLVGLATLAGVLFVAMREGYTTSTFVGNANGYAGASQTAVTVTDMGDGQTLGQRLLEEQGTQLSTPLRGRPAITPPVTEASVRDYIASHPLDLADKASNVRITGVQLLTIADLKLRLPDQSVFDAWEAAYPMVYVTFGGDLSVADPDNNIHQYQNGYIVFDGLTGNQLQSGIGPAPK